MPALILLSLLALSARPQAMPAMNHPAVTCPATPVSPPTGLEGWARKQPVRAGSTAKTATALPFGAGVTATLLPTPQVTYAVRLIGEHIEAIAREAGASSVDRAETEREAIAAALANPPSVILSDIKLAQGTGPKAVWQIRERIGPCPVIFITGTPEACVPCDYAHAILGKPVEPAKIINAFREIAPV